MDRVDRVDRMWVASDHHFGHKNILNFLRSDGSKLRDFESYEEMEDTIVRRHNEVVKPNDRVYFLGDVAIKKAALPILNSMNGRKVLIKGNHDIFNIKDYVPYFQDIRACRVFKNLILTHIPINEECLSRFNLNIHGHTHGNHLPQTEKYKNVCLEETDYFPINLSTIIEELNNEKCY